MCVTIEARGGTGVLRTTTKKITIRAHVTCFIVFFLDAFFVIFDGMIHTEKEDGRGRCAQQAAPN